MGLLYDLGYNLGATIGAIILGSVFAVPSLLIRNLRKKGALEFSVGAWTAVVGGYFVILCLVSCYYLSIADKVHETLPPIINIMDLPYIPVVVLVLTILFESNILALTCDTYNIKTKLLYAFVSVFIICVMLSLIVFALDIHTKYENAGIETIAYTIATYSCLFGALIGFAVHGVVKEHD